MILAGSDEAGLGPLAGPVMAAAVILPDNIEIKGLTDSKKCSPKKRERLFDEIQEKAVAYAVADASVHEIDTLNILQASLLAMRRAVDKLSVRPDQLWVDGLHKPMVACECHAIVQGDLHVPAISAASILAKVTRDRWMLALQERHPEYGFSRHKGYPTQEHLASLKEHGIIKGVHRQSFAPVRRVMADEVV